MYVIPVTTFSQVSLNASMAPAVNTMFIYYDANVPSPAFTFSKTGTSNTWDFSVIAAVPGADDTTFVVAPGSVTGGASFPSATHCIYEAGEGSYTMVEVDANDLTYLGAVADLTGTGTLYPLIAVPPLVAMTFPYTYGSTSNGSAYFQLYATGAAIGQPTVDSVRFKSSITAQRNVLASGNMILPSGTLPAMLERSIDSTVDSLWMKAAITGNLWVLAPGFPQTTTDSSFYWYTNQSLNPYAHALYDDTGLHDVNYFKETLTGISDVPAASHISLYPNPVSDRIYLGLPGMGPNDYSVEIYTVTGSLVKTTRTVNGQIDVSGLSAGTYFLNLINQQGAVTTMKFVRE